MKSHAMLPIALLMIGAFASTRATELPMQKPGRWETTETGDNARHFSTCVGDAAAQAKTLAEIEAMHNKICSKHDMRKVGDKWIGDSVCNYYPAGTHIINHEVTTVSENATHTDLSTTFDPSGKKSQETLDSKWVEPCKPGEKPGHTVTGK